MIIYYQSHSRIHKIHNNHGCTTTMNWFRRTCKESKITLYYWLHTLIIMQFTGLLSILFTSLFLCLSLLQKPAWFTGHENPPNKCAKITRQKNPPVKSAMKTCQIYMRLRTAEFTRRKDPPFQLTACLPEKPPFPPHNPQAIPGPPSPPPPAAPSTEQGGGDRYSYFHSLFHEWLHILIWHNICIFYTEWINMKV